MGIDITADQIEVLEQGGEVLVLQCLPEPGCYANYGDHAASYDQKGDPVMVASIMESVPTNAICPAMYGRGPGIVTFGDLISEWQNPHWNFWPSYTGSVVDTVYPFEWFDDTPSVYRVWGGTPVASIGRGVAEEVVNACNRRLEASSYQLVDRFISMTEEFGWPPYSEADTADYCEDEIDDMELMTKEMTMAGLWDSEKHYFIKDVLDYPTMSDLLIHPKGLEEFCKADAWQAWNELVERSKLGLRAWKYLVASSRAGTERAMDAMENMDKRGYYCFEERNFDPWL